MDENNVGIPLAAGAGLAAVHIFSNYLRVLDGVPRNRFLSVAGGMSVAFVVLRLLPGISKGQEKVLKNINKDSLLSALDQHVYILVLLSMFIFYGLEHWARASVERQRQKQRKGVTSARVFWIHMMTFAFMNALIGYLLVHRMNEGLLPLLLFFVAMFLKFIVNDNGLHNLHKQGYDQKGRWLLAAAVLLGWGISVLTVLPEVVPVLLQAFLAGGCC